MSEELDQKVLVLLGGFISDERLEDLRTVQTVWSDRELLIESMRKIRDWDLEHSEALSIERVHQELAGTLAELGEG